MPAVNEVRVPAHSAGGAICGYLRIALLPRHQDTWPAPLIESASANGVDQPLAPVQLLEGHEYRYEWEELPDFVDSVTADPEEVFQADTANGLKGRLRPALATGILQVVVRAGPLSLGTLELEVRSRKLNYLSEYRWMLRDIADHMTELVMERFAASSARFMPESTRDAVTLYQRFAFLRALITSERFRLAISEIRRRPHVSWEERHEAVLPGQPLKATSYAIRQLSRPGRRVTWPYGTVESVPVRLDRRRTEATHDTTPNRFVRFALERWRQVVADIGRALESAPSNPAVARGGREVAQTLEELERILHDDLFKEVGPMTWFPADNQVLQRREGYRDIFRAYLEFDLAAQLSWRASESNYAAGQRDVATLYEFWTFLQLSQLIAKLVGRSFDLRPLLEVRADGLNVALQAGREMVLSGTVERLGRKLDVQLCFNRTFGAGVAGSWTRPMRPDYSLIITAPADEEAVFEPVVLHFDAKYRVNILRDLFGSDEEVVDANYPESLVDEAKRGGALRADLLKMHAYRDAIRRSAGAYVLYPGDDDPGNRARYFEYHELLPGLGAFVLRPSEHGDAIGIGTLHNFLDHVLDHVATRLTRHERGRYWLEEAYGQYRIVSPSPAVSAYPAPETSVLLGYVKSKEHWDWIGRTKAYNVRTEKRRGGVAPNAQLLFSQLLLLYCPQTQVVALARIVSGPELVERKAMEATGYPNPSSDYLCVQLSWAAQQEWVERISAEQIDQLVQQMGKRKGEPVAVRWANLESIAR